MPPTKPPIRSPEERNRLIEPLIQPGNNWIESLVSRKYRTVDDETRQELISIGYEALIYAADRWEERYDGEGRTKFFIFAQNKVRRALREYMLNKDLPVYVPFHQHGREGFEAPRAVSVDELSTWNAYEEVKTPEEELIQKEQLEEVARIMDEHLTPREKLIVGRMNGFVGEFTPTFEQLGEELGISRQAAHEAYHRALAKIRSELADDE